MPSDERQQLLSWWLTKLDPDLENVDLAEAMNDLGICKSADVSGNNLNLYILINLKLFRLCVWKYDKDKTAKNLDKVSGHHF